MKIGYILPSFTIISGSSGGVKMQAMQWRDAMRSAGHDIIEISDWNDYDWKTFDAVHFFYFGFSYLTIYQNLKQRFPHLKFICSPIIDSYIPIWLYRIISSLRISQLKLWSEFSTLKHYKHLFDVFLVRSNYERNYLQYGLGVSQKKIKLVPLAGRIESQTSNSSKEPFCLHVSRNDDEGKNVLRLVKAAVKFNFHLILAGSCSELFKEKIRNCLKSDSKVEVLGRVSDEKLIELYSKAKVFALPSIREGVGLAALEAASYGCDIVITDIGGPKEYFLPFAQAVNPYKIDAIGEAIKFFLDGNTFQPSLKQKIVSNFSSAIVSEKLDKIYRNT